MNYIENYNKTFTIKLALYQIPTLPSHDKTFFQDGSGAVRKKVR